MQGLIVDLRSLTLHELHSSQFRDLLRLAVEVDEESLLRIIDEQLPQLSVIGAVLNGVVVGFVAFDDSSSPIVIEFIATSEAQRGKGLGRRLVLEVQHSRPHAEVYAQTDDDAIGFYRKMGFVDTPAATDLRWPERPRYDCVLAPS